MIRTDRLYVDNGSYVYAWSDKQQRIERVTTPSVNDTRNYASQNVAAGSVPAATGINKPFGGGGGGHEAHLMEMEENDIQMQQARTLVSFENLGFCILTFNLSKLDKLIIKRKVRATLDTCSKAHMFPLLWPLIQQCLSNMIVIVELLLIHTHAGAVKADKFQTTL